MTGKFKKALRDTARDAIPDDFTRWTQIRSRAQAQSPRVRPATPFLFSPRRIALVLLIALTSTVAYGVYQVTRPIGDPGLVGVQQAGYITDLNLAQVIDGIEMQLDWAYIDEGRAVLHYQVFIVHDDGRREPVDNDTPFAARLIEREGLLPDLTPNRFNNATIPEPVTMTFYLPQPPSQPLPDTVDLRFEIAFGERPRVRMALERLFSSGSVSMSAVASVEPEATEAVTGDTATFSSQITFGASSEATEEAEATREPLPGEFGPFVFDFTLPILKAITLQPMQTVVHNGVEMTLENVTVSPSKTDVRFSYAPFDDKYWWAVEHKLLLGEIATTPGGTEGMVGADGRYRMNTYFEFYAQPPATLTFTVGALERQPFTPDEFREAQREFEERGIEMELEILPDGTVSSYSWPSGLEEAKPAMVELGYRIEGPWVFTVEIPAQDGGD